MKIKSMFFGLVVIATLITNQTVQAQQLPRKMTIISATGSLSDKVIREVFRSKFDYENILPSAFRVNPVEKINSSDLVVLNGDNVVLLEQALSRKITDEYDIVHIIGRTPAVLYGDAKAVGRLRASLNNIRVGYIPSTDGQLQPCIVGLVRDFSVQPVPYTKGMATAFFDLTNGNTIDAFCTAIPVSNALAGGVAVYTSLELNSNVLKTVPLFPLANKDLLSGYGDFLAVFTKKGQTARAIDELRLSIKQSIAQNNSYLTANGIQATR